MYRLLPPPQAHLRLLDVLMLDRRLTHLCVLRHRLLQLISLISLETTMETLYQLAPMRAHILLIVRRYEDTM